MDLSKKIFGSNIDPEVQKYFKNLQKGTFEIQPGDPLSDTSFDSSTQTYLGDRTPYARMWTAVNVVSVQKDPDNPSKFKPIGDGKNSVYIVNDNSFNSYESSELNSVSELGNNPLLKPAAGVTEVTSRAEGSLGALRRTVVKFVVHNKEDFDKTFLPFFLKPGSHIFVDFGWSDKAFSLYDPNDFIKNTDLEMGDFYDTIYNDDDKIKSGFTTTVSGQVTKYDVNINQNQSFECTLEFVSANYQLLDKEVSEDNNLKFIFTNVLEDLIMLKYLNNSKEGAKIVKEELSESYLWEEIPREQRAKNIKEFFDSNTDFDENAPLIDDYSKLVGVFYQNFVAKSTSNIQAKETLYISFAVFEDDFLNNYVATTVKKDDKGNVISENVDKTSNMPKFNSRNTYIRWDKNLFNMMKIKPNSNDKILSFLYPDTWGVKETSNKYKPTIIAIKGNPREWINTDDDKLKKRIPLRELFISTTMIIEAFEASSNINDALERIFDNIFEDSGNLINIRVMKNNDFESSLTFHDVNIEPIEKKSDETFQFDITSGNTIVQNVDLKFETPKAGLSSMIAIGGLSTPNIFDEFQLMRFNILNAIQSDGKKKQIRHLPVFGELTTTENLIGIDISKILKSNPSNVNASGKLSLLGKYNKPDGRYEEFKSRRDKQLEVLKKQKLKEPKTNVEIKLDENDTRTIFNANTERDIELIKAKVENFIKTDANSISPVLPISLTLEIYGNNFLNIGDYFTINFLPEHFKERVYFQIVGVDHNISTSNWKTTYNTVMRPYSNKKYHQFGNTQSDDLSDYVKIVPNGIMLEQILNSMSNLSGIINEHQQYMVRLFNVSFQEKIQRKYDNSVSAFLKIYVAKYDINKNIKSLPEKQTIQKNNKVISMAGNIDVLNNEDQLSWLIAVSNLILGDDVINWSNVKYNNKPIASLGAYLDQGNPIGEGQQVYRGDVWVGPQKWGDGDEVGKFYNNIIKARDDHYSKFDDQLLLSDGKLRASETYGEASGASELLGWDVYQKLIDNFITNQSKKQIISEVLNISEWKGSGFHFLHRIDWPLLLLGYDENNNANKFNIITFEDDDGVKSFPVFQIPYGGDGKIFKMDAITFANKLWDEYQNIQLQLYEYTSTFEQQLKRGRDK